MEFDIYLPDLHLAFEYQGEHHYTSIYPFGDPQFQEKRDIDKLQACKRVHATVI